MFKTRMYWKSHRSAHPWLAASIVLLCALPAMDADSFERPWQDITRLLFTDALDQFREQTNADTAAEARFGEAVALLNTQPKTAENITQAGRLLRQVSTEGSETEIGIWALYLLARIDQIHAQPANPVAAAEKFSQLMDQHPGHPAAELATVKFAILHLYELTPQEKLPAKLTEMEVLGKALVWPPAVRDFHLLLANARIDLNQEPDLALAELLAADAVGFARPKAQADVWVRISEMAGKQGLRPEAATAAEKFVSRFLRDNRRFTLLQQLQEWEVTPKK